MTKRLIAALAGLLFAGSAAASQDPTTEGTARHGSSRPTVTTFASGLTSPRGFTWDDHGNMYVATAGVGGTQTATGEPGCPVIFNVFGAYQAGFTGEVIKIRPDGTKSVVASGLPSIVDSATFTALGPTDVAFVNGKLYVLIEMGGCPHGMPDNPAGIYRVNNDGSTTQVADLAAFLEANPPNWVQAMDGTTDYEPGGVWHSMLVVGDDIYIVETNRGQLVKFNTRSGRISRLYDYSIDNRNHNPIVMTKKGNDFIVGTFGDSAPAEINVFNRQFNNYDSPYTGVFSPIVGLDYKGGDLYGIEMFPWDTQYTPFAGSLVRFNNDGTHTTVLANFASFPLTLKKGPDGALYTSNQSISFTLAGDGSILRIQLPRPRSH